MKLLAAVPAAADTPAEVEAEAAMIGLSSMTLEAAIVVCDEAPARAVAAPEASLCFGNRVAAPR